MLTPDALRGRLSGVLGLCTGAAGAFGPVLGGALIAVVPGRTAVFVCAVGIAAVTVLVTISPVLRKLPRTLTIEEPVSEEEHSNT